MRVQILQVPYDSGRKDVRMGSGPEHLMNNGLAEALRKRGHDLVVDCLEAEEPFQAEIKTAFELHRLLSRRVRAACGEGRFPLTLSGNCNSSLGTVAGVGPSGLGVIWFDGHGDFNTPDTTVSGFLDGMGLATLAGLCWKSLAASIPGFRPISGENIIHVGVRDLSAEEKDLFRQTGVTVVGAEALRRSDLQVALAPALDALRARVERVYLHFDLDVLDPAENPANEFAPPDGLSFGQVAEAVRMIGERFKICAGGIASYDPRYDKEDATLQAGIKLTEHILAASLSD